LFPQAQARLQTECHGLRPFRSGDSPRWIHWRTSARRGELMVREFEEPSPDSLIVVLEAWLPHFLRGIPGEHAVDDPQTVNARRILEEAISLTATICWEWCRQPGSRLVLAIAGFGPVVVDGVTSRECAVRMLECLAILHGSPVIDQRKLLTRLGSLRLPAAPVVLIGTQAGDLRETLAAGLRRPVLALDVAALVQSEIYERPAESEKGDAPVLEFRL